ncbi:phosphonate ABC transporter ATP-binding protein [Putridiphycobacter roseus]|uniref:Cell division ATP-binding protein FtsE n=1 Tax=Putridiphycobacter roseus TaxID=2219161 RepID=A0A2W1NC24_9FLAO|nr:ATP-binding cassette domain-containing protein [Putridiphycobacter roseus]PZE16633.1 phosphonate ABC transporter ATP-binding protein [Putridiphycobacter roseus]
MEKDNRIFWIKNGEIAQAGVTILKNINVALNKGEFVYLIGRTGSGKSSFLKTLYGELTLAAGSGNLGDFNLAKYTRKQIPFLRRELGIVFQDFQLLNDRSVYKNLEFVMRSTGWKKKAAIIKRAEEVMQLVQLENKLNVMPHQLSGGEQQRVAIARALLNNPKFILADEPTGNLDPETSQEIMAVLKAIAKEGTAILMATHDLTIMEQFPSKTFKVANQTVTEVSPINEFDPFKTVEFN